MGGMGGRKKSSSKNLVDDYYGGEDILRQKLSEIKDRRRKGSLHPDKHVDVLSLSLEGLNITSEEINFDELSNFMKESQLDTSIKEALMQGVDLQGYSKTVAEDLRVSETEIVPHYIGLRNEIGELHTKIGGCVTILDSFESLLTTFQADLGNISEDIKNMQDQSMDKNMKINNRKGVISKLHRFIEDISLPAKYVEQLEKMPIDLSYVQVLASFNRKLGFIEMNRTQGDVVAIQDVQKRFNTVLDKVVARVQKYIVSHVSSIKSFAYLRETQEAMRELSFLYQFLFLHAPDNARDVKAVYMDACDKFYAHYYQRYMNSLSKLQIDIATKNDVIGLEANKLRGFFSSKLSKVHTKTSVFSLGPRISVLESLSSPPLDPLSLTSTPSPSPSSSSFSIKCPYEELFRSMMRLLADQASCEFMFVRDFFLTDDDVTFGIFPNCCESLIESLQGYLSESFDAVGMMIILCTIDRFTEEIPPNLKYMLNTFQRATAIVLTRFVHVCELNIASIRTANPQDLGAIDVRAHYVTRRYAEFAASILTLYGTLPESLSQNIAVHMGKLREAITKLITKLSEELKDKKDQTVFLINNYDLILSLIQKKGVNAEDVGHFTSLLQHAERDFVQYQQGATPYVAHIASFVDEISPLVNKGGGENINHPKFNKDVVEALLKQFYHHWKEGLAAWHADIPKLFSNFRIGMLLFQKTVDQMFSYYKQFVNIVTQTFRQLKTSKFLVAETEIVRELQQEPYNKTFE